MKKHLKKVSGGNYKVNNISNAMVEMKNTDRGEDTDCDDCQIFNLSYTSAKPIML